MRLVGKNSNAAFKIRRLCALGLSSNVIIPELLKLLHEYIPSYANVYFWVDDNGELSDVYDERPDAYSLLPIYASEFVGNRERDVFGGWPGTLKFNQAVDMDLIWHLGRSEYLRHSFHNEFLGKLGFHWGLHRSVWSGNKYHGVIQLHRAKNDYRFRPEDAQRLDKIARHLEYSLSLEKGMPSSFSTRPSNAGIITTDFNGKILNISAGIERLMYLLNEGMGLSDQESAGHGTLSALCKEPIKRLLDLFMGKETEPPVIEVRNKWGKFKITGFFMCPNQALSTSPLISVCIEHYLPDSLVVFGLLEHQQLTSRQKEVCLQICMDKPYSEIANILGVAKSTIVSHKKEIFDKFEIESRYELIRKVIPADVCIDGSID